MDEVRIEPERRSADTERPPVRPRKGRLRPAIWIGVVLLVLAALAWWVHERPARKAPGGRFGQGTSPVVPATAQTGDVDITYDALGTVTALATVTVNTQIAGQLVDVAFKEGQDVNKGDYLAQIDPRPYQATLDQYTGQLLRDQALLDEAKIDFARYQKLAAQNSIARQQAEDQEYVVQQDQGTVKLDQALVDNAKLNLSYCRIVSPVTGRVGLREVDPGNYIQVTNTTPIAVITEMRPITVIFTLAEDELPKVLKRLHAGATLPVTAYDRSNTTKLGDGTLTAVDSTIDDTTGTVKLRAEFANADETLFPNQFVNVELLIDTLKGATVIPTAAVQRGAPGTFVYVIKSDNTVSLQTVTLGPQQGEQVAVTKGLSPGDRVVVDGADKLKQGAKVTIHQETAAPASGTEAQPAQTPPPSQGQGAQQ
jgi:multidrug efflux system membrane fusion protein